MLTPIEIQERKLRFGIGYNKRNIDVFFRQLYDDYEKLYRENLDLKEKVNNMTSVLQNYKTVEKSMQKALVLAEKSADETREVARAMANEIEADARNKAAEIIADAEQEKQAIKRKIITLMAQYDSYRSQYKHLVQSQLDIIESEALQVGGSNLKKFIKSPDMADVTLNTSATQNSNEAELKAAKNFDEAEEAFESVAEPFELED